MKQIVGNIFDPTLGADAICVTTNGIVKANGELVMGAGIAKQFAERYPGLALYLGIRVTHKGNQVIGTRPEGAGSIWVFSFPTKHHWRDQSDITLIQQSAKDLVRLVGLLADQDHVNWVNEAQERNKTVAWRMGRTLQVEVLQKIILPRPGCGLGQLRWEDVKKVIEPILDDRFYIITPR